MIRRLGDTSKWINSERKCICCPVTVGYPEPDCEIHGMDACEGRYQSQWWGRIRIPRKRSSARSTVRTAA